MSNSAKKATASPSQQSLESNYSANIISCVAVTFKRLLKNNIERNFIMDCENILEELYHGNIDPNTKCYDNDSPYGKCMEIISDHEEKLNDFFKENAVFKEQENLLLQLIDAQSELSAIGEAERFVEGFQLGARFMLDTFLIPRRSVLRDIC